MADDDNSVALGSESSGHDTGQTEPSGDGGNDGASTHGQGDGGEGETPSKAGASPDNSTSDDDGSALIEALSSGDMDSIGDDGEVVSEKKDAPVKAATETETSPEPKEAASTEKSDAPLKEATKDEPVPLSDEDQAEITKAPKAYRKELTKLFEERHKLRSEVESTKAESESLKPIKHFTDQLLKHATDAGLVSDHDGKIDTSALRDLIEQEKMLKSKSPKEIADYYRAMADDVYPDGKPVVLPQDLRDLVDIGSLPEEDAMSLARKRESKAKPPDDRRQREAEAVKQTEQANAKYTAALQEAQKVGFSEINQVSKEYQTRYGAEWTTIGKAVEAELGPLLKDVAPTAWKKLAKTVIDSVVARRKAPLRKPSTTPAPTSSPAKRGDEVMSEEEEMRLLSAGKL